jgi:hypothetical protein
VGRGRKGVDLGSCLLTVYLSFLGVVSLLHRKDHGIDIVQDPRSTRRRSTGRVIEQGI